MPQLVTATHRYPHQYRLPDIFPPRSPSSSLATTTAFFHPFEKRSECHEDTKCLLQLYHHITYQLTKCCIFLERHSFVVVSVDRVRSLQSHSNQARSLYEDYLAPGLLRLDWHVRDLGIEKMDGGWLGDCSLDLITIDVIFPIVVDETDRIVLVVIFPALARSGKGCGERGLPESSLRMVRGFELSKARQRDGV